VIAKQNEFPIDDDSQPNLSISPRLFVPTNRFNVFQFQHMGMILPALALVDPYSDIAFSCPGNIPVIKGSCGDGYEELLLSDDNSNLNYPVLVELDPAKLSGNDSVVMPGNLASAFKYPIGLYAIKMFHFRSKNEMDENKTRAEVWEYPQIPYAISPELFSGGALTASELQSWLSQIDIGPVTVEQFQEADEIAAAVNAAVYSVDERLENVAVISRLLSGQTQSGGTRGKNTEPDWLLNWWPDNSPRLSSRKDLNERLFRATCETIVKTKSSDTRPAEFLDTVLNHRTVKSLVNNKIKTLAEAMKLMLSNQADLKFVDKPGFEVLDALLAFLMRQPPRRLLAEWDELRELSQVNSTALYFAGLALGRKGIPAKYRSTAIDRQIGALFEAQVNPNRNIPESSFSESSDRVIRIVLADGSVVIERVPEMKRIAELVQDVIFDSDIEQLAAKICRTEGWFDALTTVITITSPDMTIRSIASKKTTLEVRGEVVVEYRVGQKMFLHHLEGFEPAQESNLIRDLREKIETSQFKQTSDAPIKRNHLS